LAVALNASLTEARRLMREAADWICNYHAIHNPKYETCPACILERRLRDAAFVVPAPAATEGGT